MPGCIHVYIHRCRLCLMTLNVDRSTCEIPNGECGDAASCMQPSDVPDERGTSYLTSQFVVELRVYFLSRVARGVKNNQPWVGTEQKNLQTMGFSRLISILLAVQRSCHNVLARCDATLGPRECCDSPDALNRVVASSIGVKPKIARRDAVADI
ncbi:hypothetical protein BR93DRAFT_552396 [Coniochaeta sp. PMI_546]|nr:hypothetical protein BR93DRAFT_552396 [Coniochaeta sp. PMI_546]